MNSRLGTLASPQYQLISGSQSLTLLSSRGRISQGVRGDLLHRRVSMQEAFLPNVVKMKPSELKDQIEN